MNCWADTVEMSQSNGSVVMHVITKLSNSTLPLFDYKRSKAWWGCIHRRKTYCKHLSHLCNIAPSSCLAVLSSIKHSLSLACAVLWSSLWSGTVIEFDSGWDRIWLENRQERHRCKIGDCMKCRSEVCKELSHGSLCKLHLHTSATTDAFIYPAIHH